MASRVVDEEVVSVGESQGHGSGLHEGRVPGVGSHLHEKSGQDLPGNEVVRDGHLDSRQKG